MFECNFGALSPNERAAEQTLVHDMKVSNYVLDVPLKSTNDGN